MEKLSVGMHVQLKELKNASFYNGLRGKIIDLFPSEGRVLVALEGTRQLKVKFENVETLSAAPESSTVPKPDDGALFTCAVCYEDLMEPDRAVLPCCGTRESTVQYCRRCIEIIIERGIDGYLGRCPTCSKYLNLINGSFRVCEQAAGRCRMCLQQKV